MKIVEIAVMAILMQKTLGQGKATRVNSSLFNNSNSMLQYAKRSSPTTFSAVLVETMDTYSYNIADVQ